jgi:hypothetical protein
MTIDLFSDLDSDVTVAETPNKGSTLAEDALSVVADDHDTSPLEPSHRIADAIPDLPESLQQAVLHTDSAEVLIARLYEAVIAESDLRAKRNAAMVAWAKANAGGFTGLVGEFLAQRLDEGKLAEVVLDHMVSGYGRAALGLNMDCTIDKHDIRETFVYPVVQDIEARGGSTRSRRNYRGSDFDETAIPCDPKPPKRLDVAGIASFLREHFGGAQGNAKRLSEVANTLVCELGLKGKELISVRGKVKLEIRAFVSSYSWDNGQYCDGTQRSFSKLLGAFVEMHDAIDQPIDGNLRYLATTNQKWMTPGTSHILTQKMSARLFKSKVEFTMTESLADMIRVFVVDNQQ